MFKIALAIFAVLALLLGFAWYVAAQLEARESPTRRAYLRRAGCFAILAGAALFTVSVFAAEIPRAAQQYHRPLVANARAVWGLNAPVATFAGQIHQESGWRADARSPYAGGLAQFTPASADWIGGVFPELAERQPFNPAWSLRALVRFDRWLWERNPAATDCDRMAFALASYNGGEGWLRREQRAAREAGVAPDRWFDAVALHCLRGRAACAENRAYPAVILYRHQQLYSLWGPVTLCGSPPG